MKSENILRAIGNIQDDLIADAAIEASPKKARLPWAATAACLCILLAGAIIISLPNRPNNPHLGGMTTAPTDTTKGNDISFSPPYPSINLSNLEELEQMRDMSVTQDEAALQAYLNSITGLGARSRQDLLDFLALVDSIPVVQLMDGSVCLISQQKGYGASSGEYYNILKLGFEKANGDWIRLEYMLSVNDVSARVEEIKTLSGVTELSLDVLIEATGDRLTVYGERRVPDDSGTGGSIRWYLTINGIYAEVVYRSADINAVDTAQIFAGLAVIRISDLA